MYGMVGYFVLFTPIPCCPYPLFAQGQALLSQERRSDIHCVLRTPGLGHV